MATKRGRPPKPASAKKQQRLDLRVSAKEKMAFKLAADNADQELSAWIRVQLHRAASEELGSWSETEPEVSKDGNAEYDKANADRAGSLRHNISGTGQR
jgi:hypothetical protein